METAGPLLSTLLILASGSNSTSPLELSDCEEGLEMKRRHIFTMHGSFMYSFWGILSFFQIVSARYARMFWRWRLLLHTVLGGFLFVGVIAIGSLGFHYGTHHSFHSYWGWSVVLVTMLQGILGIISRIVICRVGWNFRAIKL